MDHFNTESTDPALDIEPTVVRAKNRKFRDIKVLPRWRYLGQRRITYDDHEQTCALLGETPFPKHAQGHVSAAKLTGSPEYTEKVAKMSERRAHVRTHEPDALTTNIRWCGCCTDSGAPEQNTLCCWCAEYGAPDMKPVQKNKWGSAYSNVWVPVTKKRKIRPHDKACAPLITTQASGWTYRDVTCLAEPCEPLYLPRRKPEVYTNIITYIDDDYYINAFYDIYP